MSGGSAGHGRRNGHFNDHVRSRLLESDQHKSPCIPAALFLNLINLWLDLTLYNHERFQSHQEPRW